MVVNTFKNSYFTSGYSLRDLLCLEVFLTPDATGSFSKKLMLLV